VNSGKDNIICHPNPATNITSIDINLEKAGQSKIQLFDAKGQLVKTISEKWMDAGLHSMEFDVTGLQNGIYYATLESNGLKVSRKLVITR
jgi:flagellar hook assembly protein FlgD